ncbi:uncharacterized protein METZ01_LOCUS465353 [marine metagenome]|uniref:Uncharacterized protein n=1 Tax=marine metagenome TaxID=408172 RepID=A0A383AYA2_9ZZZZ
MGNNFKRVSSEKEEQEFYDPSDRAPRERPHIGAGAGAIATYANTPVLGWSVYKCVPAI